MVLGAETIPFKDIILEQILQIDPSTIARYASLQDQLLYLVLIPHVILVIFIYLIANTLAPTSRVTGQKNVGIISLLGIVTYIFLILSGWYGTLIPIFNTYYIVMIGVGVVLFISSMFVHPTRRGELFKFAHETGRKWAAKPGMKKEYERRVKEIDDEIRSLRRTLPTSADYTSRQLIIVQISELEREKAQLRRKISGL